LNEFGKAAFLLSSSYESQLIVGVRSLPSLLIVDKQQTIQKVFPQFKVTFYLSLSNLKKKTCELAKYEYSLK
jgi:hypothetical protein